MSHQMNSGHRYWLQGDSPAPQANSELPRQEPPSTGNGLRGRSRDRREKRHSYKDRKSPTLPEHKREHIMTLINSSPFPTYTKCIRVAASPDAVSLGKTKEIKAKEIKTRESQEKEGQEDEILTNEIQANEFQTMESQAKESQANESQAKESQAKESQAKESQAKESQAKESQAKESQAKESQAKESQAKSQSTQSLKVKTHNRRIQVAPLMLSHKLQTSGSLWEELIADEPVKDEPVIIQHQAQDSEIPEQMVIEIKDNLDSIFDLIKDVDRKTDDVNEKECEILKALETAPQRMEPCKGPHIEESTMMEIPDRINALHELMKEKIGKEDEPKNIVRYLEEKFEILRSDIQKFKQDLEGNLSQEPPPVIQTGDDGEKVAVYMGNIENIVHTGNRAIQDSIQEVVKDTAEIQRDVEQLKLAQATPQQEVTHDPDPNSQQILSKVQSIYDILRSEPSQSNSLPKAQVQVQPSPPQPKSPYMGQCRCVFLRRGIPKQEKKSNNPARGFNDSLDLCQKCINDYRGQVFLHMSSLPASTSIPKVICQMIECLEYDNHIQLSHYLHDFTEQVPDWTEDKHLATYLGLFKISLDWNNIRCPLILANYLDISALIQKHFVTKVNEQQSALDVLGQLLCRLDPAESNALILGPDMRCMLFKAVCTRNVIAFKFFVTNNAPLDDIRDGRSVLHEIVFQSNKHHGGDEEGKAWNDCLLEMLDILYKHAAYWWLAQAEVNAEIEDESSSDSDTSSVSSMNQSPERLPPKMDVGKDFEMNALRYLLCIKDNKGRTPLQYATECASVEIVEKMLSHPPYRCTPDPFEFSYDAHRACYLVDDIDGNFSPCGKSALDRLLLRPPKEVGKMLSTEPFRSMISEKWHRYYVFAWLWFLLYLAYMAVFTACVIHRPLDKSSGNAIYETSSDKVRLVGELFIILGLVGFIYAEIRDLMRLGWIWPWPWTFSGLSRLINFSFFVLTIVGISLRFASSDNEDVVISLALILGWLNTLYFLVLWEELRLIPYILHTIFIKDICGRFMWLFIIALTATSTATFCVYQESTQTITEGIDVTNIWHTPYILFQLSFGLGDTGYANQARNTDIGYMLFLFHLGLFGFVVMNVLLAMVIYTYMVIMRNQAELGLWLKAWMVQLLDRRLCPCFTVRYGQQSTCGPSSKSGSGQLQYKEWVSLRKDAKGKVFEVRGHVVLIPPPE